MVSLGTPDAGNIQDEWGLLLSYPACMVPQEHLVDICVNQQDAGLDRWACGVILQSCSDVLIGHAT